MEEIFFPGFVRSTGFNEGPGHVGLVALMGCIISPFVFSNTSKSHKVGIVVSHIVCISVMILAAAKGALAAYFLFVVFLILFRYTSISTVALFSVVLFFNSSLIHEADMLNRLLQFQSGSERIIIWINLLSVADMSPLQVIFGHGRVGVLSNVSIFDSDWVFIYLTQGLFGMLMVLVLVFRLSLLSQSNNMRRIALFIALLVAGLTNPFLTDIKFGPFYWAILISLITEKQNENSSRHNRSRQARLVQQPL
jgi:hypothetical protein